MATTSQPAAGTSIPSTSLTADLYFARNEAETTASTLAIGSFTRTDTGTGPTWGTDADGRYKTCGAGNSEYWSSLSFGPEYTILAIAKFASSGADQMIVSSDQNPPRNFWLNINSTGTPYLLVFNTSDSTFGGDGSGTMTTSNPVAVIGRMRNDAGTYKLYGSQAGNSAGEGTVTGTPRYPSSGSIDVGALSGGAKPMSSTKLYFLAIWNRALSDAEIDGLEANPWAIYDSGSSQILLPNADVTTGGKQFIFNPGFGRF
jgi:hypothetical protein